ncbi:hypothetical protein J4413_00225 [Candidatus Woesearchaeota archaeon]|nr:hypothetical protein [Candidatus Woesearchaeota archaeon]
MAPEYAFKPGIKQPPIILYLLHGQGAQQFLRDFNQVIDDRYNGNKCLKRLELRVINDIPTVTGSSPLILPVAQSLVAPEKRIIRPEEIQRTLNDGDILGIRDRFYVDLGIALDFSGKNHEMAVDLFNQLPSDERTLDRVPCMLVGYGLKNFDEGQYKLNFEVTEDTTVRHASILAGQDGNFSNENVSLEDGLPCKSEEGSRRLCTTRQQEPSLDNLGISGVYLDWDLGLYSYGYDLGNSLEDGRVVVVA